MNCAKRYAAMEAATAPKASRRTWKNVHPESSKAPVASFHTGAGGIPVAGSSGANPGSIGSAAIRKR